MTAARHPPPHQGNGGSGYSGLRLSYDGRLTPIPGSTVTVPDGSSLGTASAYRDSFFGQPSSVGSSPYPDGQTAPCWEISHDGRYLFSVNAGSGTVSSCSIHPDGPLTLVGSFAIGWAPRH
jgi:hypothetical protein